MHCIYIIERDDPQALQLAKIFWWSSNEDQGILELSTPGCEKVLYLFLSLPASSTQMHFYLLIILLLCYKIHLVHFFGLGWVGMQFFSAEMLQAIVKCG